MIASRRKYLSNRDRKSSRAPRVVVVLVGSWFVSAVEQAAKKMVRIIRSGTRVRTRKGKALAKGQDRLIGQG